MSVSGTLLVILGPAIAKTILGSWLNNSPLANAISSEIVDKLTDTIANPSDRQNTQREIERIGKQIAEQMRPIFDREASYLDEGSRSAIQLAIADTLRRANVTNELLMSQDLDAGGLKQHLRNANPEASRDFGWAEIALYDRMLTEVSDNIIQAAPQLEDFSRSFATETLQRLTRIEATDRRRQDESQREVDEFERQYRRTIARELDQMEVFGMPRMDSLTSRQSLSMAYITLSVQQNPSDPQNPDADLLTSLTREIAACTQPDGELTRLSPRPVDETLATRQRLIIRGDAGAGKSTLLQWLAVRAAKQDFTDALAHCNGKIPFFIRLRTLVDKGFPAPGDFPKLTAPNHADTMPKGWVNRCLNRGQALVLIDGVDELPRQQRQDFLEALKDLVADFPDACYVITSRPTGLKDAQGDVWQEWEDWAQREHFSNLTLEPMSAANMEKFITQWHQALAAAQLPEDKQRDLNSMARNLQRLLEQRPELQRLATNPLLCAMICALHRERLETLPEARIQLYQECIEMLLERRDLGRKIKLDLTYVAKLTRDQKLALIQSFAYWLMQNSRSDVERERVDAHFDRRLEYMSLPDEVTGAQIRALFVERAGLLREPIIGRIDFAHRTFQEFLAAQAALNDDSIGVLLQHADDDQWREAIIVTAGLARPRERAELLKGLLQRGHEMPERQHYLHLLAVACLETTVEIAPDVRAQVIEQARTLLPPQNSDEARVIAKAGNAIVPLLEPNPSYSDEEAARCVKALAQIGSTAAMNAIANYAKTIVEVYGNNELSEEIGRAWDAFERHDYARTVLLNSTILRVPNLISWDGFEHLSHLTNLFLLEASISDISPVSSLSNLTQLVVTYTSISDISPVSPLSNLTYLNLHGDSISDISPVSTLSNLTSLYLQGTAISDLSPVSPLSNLTELLLSGDSISDISPVSSLSNLTQLFLIRTSVSDISLVSSLSNLTQLFLRGDSISNISPVSSLSNLTQLFLSGISISDLSPLSALSNLTQLTLHGNAISDLSPLSALSNLTELELRETSINDLSLSALSNLTKLTLQGNAINDLSPLSALSNLTELELRETSISDLSLSALSNLTKLTLHGNPISDLSPLSALSNLTELSLWETSISDLSPLVNLPNLTKLVLRDTNIRDFSPLKGLTNLYIEMDGIRKTVA
jgi:Leucine-rich repeat (LRR) protein